MAKATRKSGKSNQSGKSTPKRKVAVFGALVGALGLTSILLLALAPAPLTPDAAASLLAVDTPQSNDVLFDTHTPINRGNWQYIYIHHSMTPSGNALTLANPGEGLGDHFLIGNGDGAIDGEIQIGQRWVQQKPATAPNGVTYNNDACIGICLVGNFDAAKPTPIQMRRLTQLTTLLQSRLHIPASRVILMQQPTSAGGIGTQFPADQFKSQLLQ